jgi:hypothetical protein
MKGASKVEVQYLVRGGRTTKGYTTDLAEAKRWLAHDPNATLLTRTVRSTPWKEVSK